jgi:predicted Zn-dependent protease
MFIENYEAPAVDRYIASIGRRLARASGDRRPWKFVVLDDDDSNAFVTMGSTVYIYRGTLAALRSEAELAAVIAHEMGHLLGGHARERWAELARDAPRSAAERMLQNRYARDDEIQADEHSVMLLAKAGYDTGAVVTMLRALAGTTGFHSTDDPEAVHPWWPERIARTLALTAIRGRTGGELGEARIARLMLTDGRSATRGGAGRQDRRVREG